MVSGVVEQLTARGMGAVREVQGLCALELALSGLCTFSSLRSHTSMHSHPGSHTALASFSKSHYA